MAQATNSLSAFGSFTNESGYMAPGLSPEGGRTDSAGWSKRPVGGSGKHILLMGARRSGKTSIQRVVFNKTSPHETLFLDSTQTLDRKYICNNDFVNFEIWDFPGNYNVKEELVSGGTIYDEKMIFGNCGALLFVIDAQDEPYTEAVTCLLDTVAKARTVNPAIEVEVFIHKVDGDSFVSDALKLECNQKIQNAINEQLGDNDLELELRFYLTSALR
jgi:Ras-related GTP-binding protein C/D